jgi:hypothetical protein
MWNSLEARGLRILETGQAEALAAITCPAADVSDAMSTLHSISRELGLELEAIELVGDHSNVILACEQGS